MQNRTYNVILYFIAGVIAITLAIQVYWNYKNYQAGKQQLINEVQISLDNAVDNYYTQLAQENTMRFFTKSDTADTEVARKMNSLFNKLNFHNSSTQNIDDTLNSGWEKFISIAKKLNAQQTFISDSSASPKILDTAQSHMINPLYFFKQYKAFDTLNTHFLGPREFQKLINSGKKNPSDSLNPWSSLTSKIVVSIKTDTLATKKIDSLIKLELRRKELNIDYGLLYKTKDHSIQQINPDLVGNTAFQTAANSKFLPKTSSLELFFPNVSGIILKRNIFGILLSTLLIGSVIACLLFLLRIINNQKQLAELKNDLISNITHEFKTPIATIRVALEGITHFNAENDPKKTKNYLKTSNFQLEKLTIMVEKLLETATLDGNSIKLEKEEIELNHLLHQLVEKYRALAPEKVFELETPKAQVKLLADAFHLENALNNMLDNAVKYGGNHIKSTLKAEKQVVFITIEDNGQTLTNDQTKQLFEKFYRVPQGNTHDVKGFGIGLYYTKKIIEKHGGTISVNTAEKTTFTIRLPYD